MHNNVKKILAVLITVLMLFTSIPVEHIHAEAVRGQDAVITTDKTEYEYGEDILVTVTNYSWASKPWVGIYEHGLIPGTENVGSAYWYDLNSNTDTNFNIKDNVNPGVYDVYFFSTYEWDDPVYVTITITGDYVGDTLTLEKDEFDIGEPIYVTATSGHDGAWVSLFAIDDSIHSQSYWWYYVNGSEGDQTWVNGETYNIYDGVCNNKNGVDSPEKVIPGDYKIVLLYSKSGVYTELTSRIINIGGELPNINSITINKEGNMPQYKYGEPVLISGTCSYPTAWIGVYDVDPGPLDTGYYTYFNLKDVSGPVDVVAKAAEDGNPLEAGKQYRAYLFEPTSSNPYEFARYENGDFVNVKFEILITYDGENVDYVLSDDKTYATVTFHRVDNEELVEEYDTTDVTLKSVTEPLCERSGMETYLIRFSFPAGRVLVTDNDQQNFEGEAYVILPSLGHDWGAWIIDEQATDEHPGHRHRNCSRCDAVQEDEFIKCDTHDLIHHEAVEATCEETGNVEYWECRNCRRMFISSSADEDSERTAEEIIVPAKGHAYGEWVFDETNHKHTKTCANDPSHVISEDCTFSSGALVNEGNAVYREYTCNVCHGTYKALVFGSDKATYKQWEPTMITVNTEELAKFSDYDPDHAWIGLYPKGVKPMENRSIFWYYISNQENPFNVLRGSTSNGRTWEYGEGDFDIYLCQNIGYSYIDKITIHNTEETIPADELTLSINGVPQKDGDYTEFKLNTPVTVNVATEGFTGGSWIGLYKDVALDDQFDFTTRTSTEWFYVVEHNGEDVTFSKLDSSVAGDWTIAVFGDGGYTDKRFVVTFSFVKEIVDEKITTWPTCTRPGNRSVLYEGEEERVNLPIPELGHLWNEWTYDPETHTHTHECQRKAGDEELGPNGRDCGEVETEECSFVEVSRDDEKIYYECSVCRGTHEEEIPAPKEVERFSGKDRYATPQLVADEVKEVLGADKFENVILATGSNFADALGGGYLAARKNAPILLTKAGKQADVNAYIRENLKEGGTVYVLGGDVAVPEECLEGLEGFEVKRLSGKTRYDTNLAILNEAGVDNEAILIATGKSSADSLSASALGLPMLLVDGKKDSLSAGQKAFLEAHSSNDFYILGGSGAVSESIEKEIRSIHTPIRLSGKTRYDTTIEIAKTFYPDADRIVIAAARDAEFPDGLCAGPLAYALKAPIILTNDGKSDQAAAYAAERSITSGYITGGTARISDETAGIIFGGSE